MADAALDNIHVLLVEHDVNCCKQTVEVLQCFSYDVTVVPMPSAALRIVSERRGAFDLLILRANSPDPNGWELMLQAVALELPVILTMDEDDGELTAMALDSGVYLCIKRPVEVEMAEYMWQYVFREKLSRRQKESREEKRVQGNVKKKVWTEWTQELHEKFEEVAYRLAKVDRCFPKDILEEMGVPGLTRMQIASHLQKCRNEAWVPPGERRSRHPREKASAQPAAPPGSRKRKAFGVMPKISNKTLAKMATLPGDGGAEECHRVRERDPEDDFISYREIGSSSWNPLSLGPLNAGGQDSNVPPETGECSLQFGEPLDDFDLSGLL